MAEFKTTVMRTLCPHQCFMRIFSENLLVAGGMARCVMDKFNNEQTKVYEWLFLAFKVLAMHSLWCLPSCCRVMGALSAVLSFGMFNPEIERSRLGGLEINLHPAQNFRIVHKSLAFLICYHLTLRCYGWFAYGSPTFWCIFLWRHTTPEIEVKSSSDIAALGTVLLISGARIATVTPEKSPHAKTAYWKCLWATVYVNSRLSVLAAVWALSDLLVLQHSFHTQTLYKAAKPLRTPTALGEGEKFVKTQTNWHQKNKKTSCLPLGDGCEREKETEGREIKLINKSTDCLGHTSSSELFYL